MQCSVGTNGVANVTKISNFFPFLRTYRPTEDSLREALKQVINDYLGVSVSFELRSSNSILGTRCESILAPISLQQSCSHLLTEQLIMQISNKILQNSPRCLNLPIYTHKCICGTTVIAHVAEKKTLTGVTEIIIFCYFGDYLNIWHFYSKSFQEHIYDIDLIYCYQHAQIICTHAKCSQMQILYLHIIFSLSKSICQRTQYLNMHARVLVSNRNYAIDRIQTGVPYASPAAYVLNYVRYIMIYVTRLILGTAIKLTHVLESKFCFNLHQLQQGWGLYRTIDLYSAIILCSQIYIMQPSFY